MAVDQQRARTASALLAAKMGAGQTKVFAQKVGKMRARLHSFGDLRAVDGQTDAHHCATARAAARIKAVM